MIVGYELFRHHGVFHARTDLVADKLRWRSLSVVLSTLWIWP